MSIALELAECRWFPDSLVPYGIRRLNRKRLQGNYRPTGGMMPSDDLIYRVQDHLEVEKHLRFNGRHYQKTAEARLRNLDARKKKILSIMQTVCGDRNAWRWFQRWRILIVAFAELWGFDPGQEWLVSHYLLRKKGDSNEH